MLYVLGSDCTFEIMKLSWKAIKYKKNYGSGTMASLWVVNINDKFIRFPTILEQIIRVYAKFMFSILINGYASYAFNSIKLILIVLIFKLYLYR